MTPDASTRPLARRYRVVLGLVACLLLLNQLVVQPPLFRLLTDAPRINLAGRQRMLSQRLAKAALALDRAEPSEQARHLLELAEVLERWSTAHDDLCRGDSNRSLSGPMSTRVKEAFVDLEPSYNSIHEAAAHLVAGRQASRHQDLAAILEHEGAYLERMERIVGLYEREAQNQIDRLIWTGWGVTGLILACVAALGGSILRPALRRLDSRIKDLDEARDVLENRVKQRTIDLETANAELREAAQRQAVAEERSRALVEQYGQTARANMLGEMAGSLAHELNQPLGAIANYTEGCLVAIDSPCSDRAEIKEALNKSLAATLRAGAILRRIRRFVTRRGPIREWFDANSLVREVVALCSSELAKREIPLELELASDLPLLWGDSVQIQQVLVNLVRNAIDAVVVAQPKQPQIQVNTRLEIQGELTFVVADNGEGISADRLAKMFDPFFSTRAEGMGIGLSISRRILDWHSGRIQVDSELGIGTTFYVTLPSAHGDDERTDRLHR